MNDLLHRSYGFDVRALDEEKRCVDVIASTSSIDAYAEIVVQDWDLARYLKNPVVLFGHNSYCMPIGHAENVRVENGQLLATLFFVDARATPTAEQVWQGIVQGSLRAVSVGFRTKAATQQDVGGVMRYVLTGNELLEISVVPIPANPDCVAREVRTLECIKALVGERVKEIPMSALVLRAALVAIATLGLSEASTDGEVVDKVKTLDGRATDAEKRASALEVRALAAESRVTSSEMSVKSLLDATGTDSIEKALGAIKAGSDAIIDLKAKSEQFAAVERATIIDQAKRDKKLTPHQEKGLEGKSLDFVKSFIELQCPNPALEGSDVKQPVGPDLPAEYVGKSWEDLTSMQKHNLLKTHPEVYEALKAKKKAA